MTFNQLLEKLSEKVDLTADEMTFAIRAMMSSSLSDIEIAGFLMALNTKGITPHELAAAAVVMRELAVKVELNEDAADIVGTGGDKAGLFNVSTTAAFVVAAAGVKVAKHGNRSVSSLTGSADVLEAAGVNIMLNSERVVKAVSEVGIAFMFAPNYHPAMAHVMPVRKALKVRTIFNLLGPLCNPAQVKYQVVGVFPQSMQPTFAYALRDLGSEHALVVHSEDHLDEISIAAPTRIFELKNNQVSDSLIHPEDFGMKRAALAKLKVNSCEESLNLMQQVLDNTAGPALDMVALNAGAAIYVAGQANNIAEGVEKAKAAIASGRAKTKLEQLIAFGEAQS